MTDHVCARCERPMHHDTAIVCGHCGAEVRAALARTAKLAGEVAATIAKLDRVPRTNTKPDDLGWWKADNALEAIALPFRPEASQAHRSAYGELVTWTRHIIEQRGGVCLHPSCEAVRRRRHSGPPCVLDAPPATVAELCAWLAGHIEWLRHRPEADEALKAIEDACKQLERIVDRPPDRVVVGTCPCGTWLYAIAGADTVTCAACNSSYEVEASRQQLRDDLEDRLMTGAEIATMAAHLGIVRSRESARNAIKTWAQRGRITAHATHEGNPLYRFGDTLGLLIDAYARAA